MKNTEVDVVSALNSQETTLPDKNYEAAKAVLFKYLTTKWLNGIFTGLHSCF